MASAMLFFVVRDFVLRHIFYDVSKAVIFDKRLWTLYNNIYLRNICETVI